MRISSRCEPSSGVQFFGSPGASTSKRGALEAALLDFALSPAEISIKIFPDETGLLLAQEHDRGFYPELRLAVMVCSPPRCREVWRIYGRGVTPTHELFNFRATGLPLPLRCPASYVSLGQPIDVVLLIST